MNKIMTVKFEKDIGISDEEKNKLRYTLVLHFMEQLKQKGMYKVEEEKHDGKWVISASLVMPTIEAEPVNGWISVDDRLPKTKMDHVLFTLYTPAWHDITDELPEDERDFPEEYVTVCGWFDVHDNGAKRYWSWISSDGYQSTIRNEYVKDDTGMITHITHWQPLPEPPKGE